MIKRLLIANRGEIACRIIRTAKQMGIETVAVYSDADNGLPHTRLADYAVHIGPPPARESYLDVDRIIEAAIGSDADAIHPGYGFLSENTELANRCEESNIVFVGPSTESIRAMGSKSTAKQLMEKAGVPLLPGYHGDKQDDATLSSAADKCGYPVLIKASAGGGGKGMRIVGHPGQFADQLASARREAMTAFGNDKVIVEKYLEQPRHIEVQVFGDNFGKIVHLFDRDCSVQRRYQKVVEEAPAPNLGDKQRKELHDAAVRAAKVIEYTGAGTVEFICSKAGDCYFMEMNTRLQVEHPVTEMVTGLDLVEWQLRIASGEPVPLAQDAIQINGHAIEARIYAEDPDTQFLPSTGTISHCHYPNDENGVRVDSGFQEGDKISIYYDPMVAKVIAYDKTRDSAISRLHRSLSYTRIGGVRNNVDFLMRVIDTQEFRHAEHTTGFLDEHLSTILRRDTKFRDNFLAIASLYLHNGTDSDEPTSNCSNSPWSIRDNWRLNTVATRSYNLVMDDEAYVVSVSQQGTESLVTILDNEYSVRLERYVDKYFHIVINGRRITAEILNESDGVFVYSPTGHARVTVNTSIYDEESEGGTDNQIKAPMPGKVIAVLVEDNVQVSKGQPLITLEAMKMEHTLTSPGDGVVNAIHCTVDDTVDADRVLIEIQGQ